MLTADDVFSETFGRFTRNWTVMSSLRHVMEKGSPYAEMALDIENAALVEMLATDPEYKKIIVNIDGSDKPLSEETKDFLRAGTTKTAITNARTVVDAASLVFAQSILDDCAWSYCRVCSLALELLTKPPCH
jgi:hypothetical protein